MESTNPYRPPQSLADSVPVAQPPLVKRPVNRRLAVFMLTVSMIASLLFVVATEAHLAGRGPGPGTVSVGGRLPDLDRRRLDHSRRVDRSALLFCRHGCGRYSGRGDSRLELRGTQTHASLCLRRIDPSPHHRLAALPLFCASLCVAVTRIFRSGIRRTSGHRNLSQRTGTLG